MLCVKCIVQKYGFGHYQETDFVVNANDFTDSEAYISVAVISKTFTYGHDTLMRPCFCTMVKWNNEQQHHQCERIFTFISLLAHPTKRVPCTHNKAVMTESQAMDPTSTIFISDSPPVASYNIASIVVRENRMEYTIH